MLTDAPIRAVLIDVGGPIIDESVDYSASMEILRDLIGIETGRIPELNEIESARQNAIVSFAPSFNKAIIWQFLKPDVKKTVEVYKLAIDRIFSRCEEAAFTDGIIELVEWLAGRYKLAIAGNQPEITRSKLERTGLLKHFDSSAVSAEIGYSKPDTRFFLEICRRIDVQPGGCVMIGDRLDNDIYPANVIGMRTIHQKTGPHAFQEPRVPEDVPDAVVKSMSEVREVITNWEKRDELF